MRGRRIYRQLLALALCAAAETRMWQAYYGNDPKALAVELVSTLRAQFGLSYVRALQVGNDLAEATLAFQRNRDHYEEAVLPHLESAYGRLRSACRGRWDARAAARAELDWWAARRTPGHDRPEQVGRDIAKLYAILYGKSNPQIERAGLLRAQAASLRDRAGLAGPEGGWAEITRLLEESYTALVEGVS